MAKMALKFYSIAPNMINLLGKIVYNNNYMLQISSLVDSFNKKMRNDSILTTTTYRTAIKLIF